MKISEVQGLLSKVQSITGDVEVVLKAAESEAETIIQSVAIELGADGGTPTTVTVAHAPAPEPTPAAPVEQPTGQETNAPTDPPA